MAYSLPWTDLSLVCMPLRTLDELINFHKSPVQWKTLVEPLATRTGPRKSKDFDYFGERAIKKENRREILVCHDFKGESFVKLFK